MCKAIYMMIHCRVIMQFFMLLMLVGLLVACGSGTTATPSPTPTSKPAIPGVTIIAKDFSFDMPNTLPAGMVDITLVNQGAYHHQANLARLNNGVTPEQFMTALKKNQNTALPLVTFAGGPNGILPGQRQEVILNLPTGQYVAICFLSDQDNVPHYQKGMIKFFQVMGPAQTGSAPAADGQVTLRDFSYVLPSTIKTGPLLLKATNQGTQPHEMTLFKLAPGRTQQDLLAYLQKPAGPPPFADAGGIAALAPGTSGWFKVDLAPGNYVAMCFVPDPATGKPHFAIGMISSFAVQ